MQRGESLQVGESMSYAFQSRKRKLLLTHGERERSDVVGSEEMKAGRGLVKVSGGGVGKLAKEALVKRCSTGIYCKNISQVVPNNGLSLGRRGAQSPSLTARAALCF